LLEEPFLEVQMTYPGITEENYQSLVNYALDWDNVDYWPGKAIEWLENGLSLSEDTAKRLAVLSSKARLPKGLKARIDVLLTKSTQCDPA
jgi:hypothetical protein